MNPVFTMNPFTMNRLISRWLPAACGFLYIVLGTLPVWADDTEIYFGTREAGVRNNILFVIDTSGSMGGYDGDSTTRLQELKSAFRTLLQGLDNVNVGLMRFSNPGGPVLYPVSSIDEVLSTGAVETGNINKSVETSGSDGYEFNSTRAVHIDTAQLEMGANAVTGIVAATANVQVSDDLDDAESRESNNTDNSTNGNSLDTPSTENNGSNQQIVGVRFSSVNIPVGATITSAYLQFVERDHGGSAPFVVNIHGEKVSGGQFSGSDNSSNSPHGRFAATANLTTPVTWTMTALPADDSIIQTPDLSALIQSVVGNAGWTAGKPITFLMKRPTGSTATGRVGFVSRKASSTNQPRLIVNYTTGTASTAAVTTAVRFNEVNIPRFARITDARLEFVAGTSLSGAAAMDIAAELAGNSAALAATAGNISSRSKTATVRWDIADAWAAGNTYSSPSLTALVQAVVNQSGASGWCGGNAMTFLLNGTLGRRIAEAYDNGSDSAPKLVVSYDVASVPTDGTTCKQSNFVRQIASGVDDAEEDNDTSNAELNSTVLDLAAGNNKIRRVGLRFNNIKVPRGATIQSAYLEFRAANNDSSTLNLSINGEASDDSAPFAATDNNISARAKTSATVSWSNVPAWTNDETYQSPNIASLVQESVNRSGWAPGNDMTFIIDGSSTSNRRRADSYNGAAGSAPKLVINFADNGATETGYTVRDKLIDIVDSLAASGNTPLQDTFYEAVQYYRGQSVDYGKVRGAGPYAYTRVSHPSSLVSGSYSSIAPAGCQDSSATGCASETISGSPIYKSPISYACQSNHVVLLTDGQPNSDHSTTKIRSLPGFPTAACSYGSGGASSPELAAWANKNVDISAAGGGSNNLSGTQNLVIDTIAFYQDADGNQFLEDIARQGGGQYHAAASATDLALALQKITTGTISENASFVAAGTGVNAFNRAFNGDELYFAVFRPEKKPRWPGNLKKYKIDFVDNASTVALEADPVIVDADGADAVDSDTGFFAASARSFWSSADDGATVTAGGFAARVTDYTTRKLYTDVGTSAVLSDASNRLTAPSSNPRMTQAAFGVSEADYPAATDFVNLVNWTRGFDFHDEDGNTSTTTRYVVGDLLHSKPVAITYGGTATAPDTTVFVTSNSGFFHAVDDDDGSEVFSYIPKELLPLQRVLFENVEGTPHPYGLDSSITAWVVDPDNDGVVLDSHGAIQENNRVYLYFGMGRGGRNYYALDVTDRANPKVLWTIRGGVTEGFEALGQTWAQPTKAIIHFNGSKRRVLIFGGGYDAAQDSTTVRSTDSMGAAIYMVDAITGELIWKGGNGGATAFTDDFDDMLYSIPSSVASADVTGDGFADFFFVGDVGGQVWRFDIANGASTASALVSGGVIADLGVAAGANTALDNRRFYHAPSLFIGTNGSAKFLGVVIGSGWQGHPLSEDTTDRFYMLRQSTIFGAPSSYAKLTENDLYDTTANLIGEGTTAEKAAATQALTVDKNGWFITMGGGEKVLSSALVINNRILFNTYEPGVSASANPCLPSTGINRGYEVAAADGQPTSRLSTTSTSAALTRQDRARDLGIPGIGGDPTLVYTPDGAAVTRNQRSEKADLGTDTNIKRIYWHENRAR